MKKKQPPTIWQLTWYFWQLSKLSLSHALTRIYARAQAAWHRGPGVAAIHGILLCGGSGIPSSGRLATLTMLLLDDAGGALAGEAEARPREPAPTLLIGLPRPASTLLIGLPRRR